jgi:LuxR family maltose regulon positive regulatory protein
LRTVAPGAQSLLVQPVTRAMNFARTKLLPPRPRAGLLVQRAGLQRRLGEALLTRKLVLLCAPAGYGKTATLAQQVDALPAGTALAWIAADEGDDLSRLLDCLVTALEPWDPPWRTAPEAFVSAAADATPRERRAMADEVINTLDACDVEHGVIVVDDLHRIDDPAVFAFIDHLLERLTPRWTLALTSRHDPPLALARLRAAGELTEIRQADLRFAADEARQLVAGAGLDPALADALVQRTQGWAAGLRLAVNALQHHDTTAVAASAAIDRPLLDFIAAEVIDRLPDELRLFLLRTSVLPELSPERAAAVSGHPHAAALLDEVLRHGLFVSVHGAAEPTLRLHDLLREGLEQRLRRDHADEVPPLLRRAAAGETDPQRRIGWLLQAGAHDDAQRALADAAPALLAAGDSARVLRLLDLFPPALHEASPLLAYARGLAAWPRFEWVAMDQALAQAAAGFERAGMVTLARRARGWRILALAGIGRLDESRAELDALTALQAPGPPDAELQPHLHLMAFWLSGACGPADGPARHLGAMLATLSAGASAAVWYRCAPHFMFIGRPGLLAPMQEYVSSALGLAGDVHVPLRAAARALGACMLLWQGRIEEADDWMALALEDDRWLGGPRSLRVPVRAYQAARATLAGDAEAVLRHGLEMIDDVDHDAGRRPIWYGVYVMMTGRMALACGDIATTRAMHERLQQTPAEHEWPFMAGARRVLEGGVALHAGRLDTALALFDAAAGQLAPVETFGLACIARVMAARTLLRAGDVAAAAARLRPVLSQVRAGATVGQAAMEVGGVWMTGRDTVAALARAPWAHHLDAQDVQLLAAWAQRLEALAGAAAVAAPASGERARGVARGALSSRECEVLERIAAGDSNKLIARAFDLSPHTVKRHVANILDKLALDSRGQAAAWYRSHGQRLAG